MGQQRRSRLAAIATSLLLIPTSSAWYLPGVAPTTYKKGDIVPLHVNRLTPAPSPSDGQVHSVLSFDYYARNFHFCRPKGDPQYVSESLGSILFGDRIKTSPFELKMRVEEKCKVIPDCGPREYEAVDAKFVNKRIAQNFNLNWLVDGLPAGQLLRDRNTKKEFYSPGFALGHMDEHRVVFNTHYDIMIDYHEIGEDRYRVVGILVNPSSNKNSKHLGGSQGECGNPQDLHLDEKDEALTKAVFTYSVSWRPSSTPFATRWDKYLYVYNPRIHWFWLTIVSVVVTLLSGMVFVILVHALKKDITRYNRLDQFVLDDMSGANGHGAMDDSVQEDSGWKLIHGDVFRPPRQPLLLSIMVGNGTQLFMMTGFTIAFALLGFLSPSNRGSIGSIMILLYTLFGGIGGFTSSYTYKCISGDDNRWKQNLLFTPIALPAVVFGTFFLLNLFLWFRGSSGAVPFTTMLILILIWFVISVPLSFAGSWVAFKRRPIPPPVRTNQIPRQIPDSATLSGAGVSTWLNRPFPAMLLTGILPFGAIFIELYFIMSSLWSAEIYYMFGFLFICFGLMVVTCATATVLSVYFLLCNENYHWQWRAFGTSGACAAYVFAFAMVFWASRLSFGSWTSGVLYLGYSALISVLVFVLTGTIGFVAAWMFVHRIYRSIKVD